MKETDHLPERGPAKKVARWEIRILTERCKGCGFCVEFCGKHVLVVSKAYNRKGYHPPEVVKQEECSNCKLCEMLCPDFSIFIVKASDAKGPDQPGEKSEVHVDPEEGQRRAAIES